MPHDVGVGKTSAGLDVMPVTRGKDGGAVNQGKLSRGRPPSFAETFRSLAGPPAYSVP